MGNAIGSGISALGNSIDTIMTNKANKQQTNATNEANVQMNAVNNVTNAMLAKQQNDWNVQQWERNNEYNKPSAQVQRLLQAGINPLSASVGNFESQSVQSAELANQQSGHVEPARYERGIGAGITTGVEQYIKGIQADAVIADLRNQMGNRDKMTSSQVDAQHAETTLTKEKIREQKVKSDWSSDLTSAQYDSIVSGNYLNYQTANRVAELLPKEVAVKEGEIQNLAATFANIVHDTLQKKAMTNKMKLEAVMTEMENQYFKKNGVKVENGVKDEILKDLYHDLKKFMPREGESFGDYLFRMSTSTSHSNPRDRTSGSDYVGVSR